MGHNAFDDEEGAANPHASPDTGSDVDVTTLQPPAPSLAVVFTLVATLVPLVSWGLVLIPLPVVCFVGALRAHTIERRRFRLRPGEGRRASYWRFLASCVITSVIVGIACAIFVAFLPNLFSAVGSSRLESSFLPGGPVSGLVFVVLYMLSLKLPL